MGKTSSKSFRSGRLRLHLLPILVWLGTVACVAWLFTQRWQRFEFVGLAQEQVRQIAATCTGRVRALPVELFDRVTEGQTLAIIDTVLENENIEAQLNTALGEIQRLMAELIATESRLLAEAENLETDKLAAHRRFSVDIERARLGALELKTLVETDRIMLENLAVEVKIAENLLAQDAIMPYELQKVQAEHDVLAKKIEENRQALKQAAKDLGRAQQRYDKFVARQVEHPSLDSELEAMRKAIRAQELYAEELLARRQALVLKSPVDGVVSQILSSEGDVVLPGGPLLAIAETEPREVVAYLNEQQMGKVRERMPVELVKKTEPPQIAPSQVVNLGPAVAMMPQQLWRNPNIPEWGRPILIKIPPDMKLVSGELVGIRGL